jgi:hypothetical protein
MSFIRPELRAELVRWRETLIGAGLASVGVYAFWRGLVRLNWMAEALGLVLIVLGLSIAWAGWRRARFSAPKEGPGLVEVTERQIRYLSPYGGGFIDIEAISRLEVRDTIEGGREWVIRQSGAPSLHVPLDATGAERLYDAFILLPDIDEDALVRAANGAGGHRDVIWRGNPGFPALT